MSNLLEFKDISYWYTHEGKQQPILKDINIAFEKGLFYTVTGPSGSGKTTFLSLASALDLPKSGDILYEGKNIQKIGLTNFRNQFVSIVFQSYNLLPYMTALQNIVTAMEITKSPVSNKKTHALKMLQRVGITEDKAKQKVLTLSGGQQQRVSIARALCCNSNLIVADEPTGNLDEDTAKEIVRLFQHIAHHENKCVIMVTHDQQIANASDVIVKLSKGSFTVQYKKQPEFV
ncbi:ABC transporter ATP-binding protein [Cytobacillus spongiae]|jgi:putative ABC transport system ATP-binding protein|uniref:ABC transporter ATP-binding protein n=1 Tax=Cytobacillus spongiae TaxID=2901381 RepID=UPI001F251915|nr:ABC transporter ATP-binding protein [Cytobacillus spongiae]UII56821.1 ABC transporter ATP-binding protein [Cytobacillus spongiae]